MVTYNAQRMLHGKKDLHNMETIQDYRYTQARERLCDSEELQTNLRRDVCARVENAKQETNEAHSLYEKISSQRRLKYRTCSIHSVKPANFPSKVIRCREWPRRTNTTPHRSSVNHYESIARGHTSHGQRGGVSTDYVQVTHAACSSRINGNT